MQDKNKELVALSENPAAQFWKVSYEELADAEPVFVSVWELEAEVNNGGFIQYFFNSSGDNANYCVAALGKIGAANVAELVKQANSIFENGEPPTDSAVRQPVVESLTDEKKDFLDQLDQKFFKYPDNLTELLYDFVMKNRTEIRGLN